MGEVSDDELERRMRQKLLADGAKPKRFTDEEERIARSLIGRDNAERLDKANGDRKFRPSAVIVKYEFFWLPANDYMAFARWRIERIENGRKEVHREGGNTDELLAEIAALRKRNFTVREVTMGLETRAKDKKPASARKAILARIGSFRA